MIGITFVFVLGSNVVAVADDFWLDLDIVAGVVVVAVVVERRIEPVQLTLRPPLCANG